jgi:hypothetical protein
MTAAERIKELGFRLGQERVAISLLKDGAEPIFIARNTEIDLADILKLKAQLEQG